MSLSAARYYTATRINAAEVVERLALNLKTPSTWCRGMACQGRYGDPCDPLSFDARRWGGSTALYRAEFDVHGRTAMELHFPIWRELNHRAGGFAELNLINDRDGREMLIQTLRELVGEFAT